MRKETCAVCGKIVYVEQGEDFEWDPGALLCKKLGMFFCAEHKPCCDTEVRENECIGYGEENDDNDFDDYDDDESFEDTEGENPDLIKDSDINIDMEV